MEPDSPRPESAARDAVERAHLREPGDASHVMYRYPASAEFEGLLRRFWIPVWSVPPGQEAPQRVLQYPVALVVVSVDYARFYGVVSGLSTTTLTGDGWAVGVMCAPAAGSLLAGGPMTAYTDRFVDVAEVLGAAGERLADRVRAAMAADPHAPAAHAAAVAAFGDALRPLLPVDAEGELVNRVVAFVEEHPEVTRVAQVCERFDLSERALQRLTARRLGLTPKWLVQRRRLQEAAGRLRASPSSIGEVAAALGYADQAHLTRDFARVTGTTPGRFAARHAPGAGAGTP
ncbi:AraC family transcriptional regulator [Geodermatophilus sp. DSM 44513]|uniref:helix-turn-helix domain-containing protein n=1 Tax=Geodermatophilus sp. DSM 44513 TaxID=1528104 RepID=UPI00126D33BC|nr:AraC family transcriptional regulator [Geodermatophilus sp. DSM 44513]WNV77387.1 AraC family transcriptional regulator [Geodermatophilus sp. DSM 44513]